MTGRDVLLAMLPEHLLLLGIVLLSVLEIAGLARRAALPVALVAVAAAVWAAARLSFDGYAAAPFAGHFSVDAATPKSVSCSFSPDVGTGWSSAPASEKRPSTIRCAVGAMGVLSSGNCVGPGAEATLCTAQRF